MRKRKTGLISLMVVLLIVLSACGSAKSSAGNGNGQTSSSNQSNDKNGGNKTPIKIGIVAALSGSLEAYGKQTVQGFKLGIQYATNGTNKVNGHPIKVITEDGEAKPDVAVKAATKLLGQDKVDFLVGPTSSASGLAMEPLAKQYKKILVVEPAVADSITGKGLNPYVFRTGRNSSQDAAAAAAAIAKKA